MKGLVLQGEQFVTDRKGKRVGVLLDFNTYNRLRDAEEELADVRAYDASRPKVVADVKAERIKAFLSRPVGSALTPRKKQTVMASSQLNWWMASVSWSCSRRKN